MKAAILLLFLPACAVFDPPTIKAPARVCIVGQCAHLQPTIDELSSAEMTVRLCAAGAMTEACGK